MFRMNEYELRFIASTFTLVMTTVAYPNITSSNICQTMALENDVPPQTSEPPYELKIEIQRGRRLRLSITVQPKTQDYSYWFRGFFLQIRDKTGGEPIGEFRTKKAFDVITCPPGQNNTLTRSNFDRKKKFIKATWTWPEYFKGKAYAIASVARDKDEFWVGIKEDLFTFPHEYGF